MKEQQVVLDFKLSLPLISQCNITLDCRVFACMYGHYLQEDGSFNFNQVDIKFQLSYRKKITLEIIHKALYIVNIK